MEAQANTDSSSAQSTASRRGAGQVRHIEVRVMCIQGRRAKGELTVMKGKGEYNVADGLTKHVERHKMNEHITACGVLRKSSRHTLCPYLGDAQGLDVVLSHSTSACVRLLETCR